MPYPLFHPDDDRPPPLTISKRDFAAAFPEESEFVEWKKGIGGEPLQEAIVAFSNTAGGVILIGVGDDGRLHGRELTQGTEDAIHEVFSVVVDPGRHEFHALDVGGTTITVIAVSRRLEGFSQTSNGRVMVRRGTRKVALLRDDLRRFINERALDRFEEADSGVPFSAAKRQLLAEVAAAFGFESPRPSVELLRNRGMVTANGRQPNLTVAGALYLVAKPDERLGKAFIEVLRFPEGSSDYDRRIAIRGPLHHQVATATQMISDELGRELVVLGLRRHEIPRLPEVVLREAIANAVAHRSYELTGTAIRIELRPDSVRIVSPGGLPEPVTIETLREAQAARNLRVITLLRHLGLAEDAGRGIDVIEDSMREELLDPPVFAEQDRSVVVTLPIRSTVAPSERAWVREVEQRGLIEPSDRVLLVHAARGEILTNGRVRELLSVDSRDARAALRRLRDAGFLIQRGERGGATYVLEEGLAPPAGLRLSHEALKEVLLEMAREEPLTNARVRQRTGLDRAEALRLLDQLTSEKLLRRVGSRRGTRYLLRG